MAFDFVGDAYAARSVNAACQQAINYYLEKDPEGWRLYGTPGSSTIVTLGGTSRAAMEYRGISYWVTGNKFYSKTAGNVIATLGTLNTATGFAKIVTNGLVILIVDGVEGYTFTLSTGTFELITDPDFPSHPISAAVLKGTFMVPDGGTQTYYISTTGTSWSPADFASAESNPDDLAGIIADDDEVILFGKEISEAWFYSGDASFALSFRSAIKCGLAGVGASCNADNTVFFLDQHGIVRRLNTYTGVRVSTHAIEYAISKMPSFADCIMWSQVEIGHTFIWCQFPSGNQTWVYDVAAAAAGKSGWHRRVHRDPDTGAHNRHRANCYVYANGKHLIGDYQNGSIMELRSDLYDDDGDPLPAIRVCRHIQGGSSDKAVRHAFLIIKPESGVGLASGQGYDPQMMLKWSDDDGHKWSNEIWLSMGKMGEYNKELKFGPLGSVRPPAARVYWCEVTDPVKRVIISGELKTK